MRRRAAWAALLLVAGLASGCGHAPAPPPDTGSREAVRDYYEALVRQDWGRAYTALHPDSRARCSAEQFTRLAQSYRRNLGFEPEEVQVRSCEEHGDEAVAHVMLNGRPGGKQRHYKDAATLRHSGSQWGIVLPRSFGGGAPR
jgi:hypothetical protein